MAGTTTFNSEWYDMEYFDGGKGYFKYDDADHYGDKANYIIEKYKPKTVLDVGCAKGFLVAALRYKGIKAFGVDISEYAIDKAPSVVQPYLFQTDITNNKLELPKYDLVVSYDTLEHIPEHLVGNALTFIKQHGTKQYLIVATTNTPDWQHDESHVTIKNIAWWKEKLKTADWEESK